MSINKEEFHRRRNEIYKNCEEARISGELEAAEHRGETNNKYATAKELLLMKMSLEDISRVTELSIDEIKILKTN